MKINKLSLIILSLALVVSLTVCASHPNKEEDSDTGTTTSGEACQLAYQEIVAIPSPSSATFAGEKVPLENFDVDESLSRELTSIVYGHGTLVHTIRLSSRFFPVIEPILKEQGIPDDFKYLCVAESNLQNVVSPAKAAGYWQFLAGTAKEFGLEVNADIDERYNIEKATVAACKYFKQAYAKYGSWTLAAASYNVGMSHINGQIERQKTDSYYDMSLNLETARYVYRAIAYKEIMSNPAAYGFNISQETMFRPLEYKEVQVKTDITNLADFAIKNGTNYKMLKVFNPWLRSAQLTNKSKKTYTIKIPKEGFRDGSC